MAPDNAAAISPGDAADRIMTSVNGRGSTIWVMGTSAIGSDSSRRREELRVRDLPDDLVHVRRGRPGLAAEPLTDDVSVETEPPRERAIDDRHPGRQTRIG